MSTNFRQTDRQTDRQTWIDVCRGIVIVLVVLGHGEFRDFPILALPSMVQHFIFGFHMPFFFIISGYLYKSVSVATMAKKAWHRYLIPYFILSFINLCIIGPICAYFDCEPYPIFDYFCGIIYSCGQEYMMYVWVPLWFLTGLTSSLLIYTLICRAKNHRMRIACIILCALYAKALDFLGALKLPWNIDTACMGVLFLAIGQTVRQKNIMDKFDRLGIFKRICLLTVVLCIGSFSIVNNRFVDFNSNTYGNLILMILGSCCLSFFIMAICHKCLNGANIVTRGLSYLGRHTIYIIGFDYFSGRVATYILNTYSFGDWFIRFCIKMMLLIVGMRLWYFIIGLLGKNSKIYKLLSF